MKKKTYIKLYNIYLGISILYAQLYYVRYIIYFAVMRVRTVYSEIDFIFIFSTIILIVYHFYIAKSIPTNMSQEPTKRR